MVEYSLVVFSGLLGDVSNCLALQDVVAGTVKYCIWSSLELSWPSAAMVDDKEKNRETI